MTSHPTRPTVHILLATCQGASHLRAQLESIAAQTHADWKLLVSDDGSTDDTTAIVQRFAATQQQQVTLQRGPCKGATANFFHLINSVAGTGPSDLFAFCDQDDVWLPEKLAVAVAWHKEGLSLDLPALYCGRTRITDAALEPIGESDIPRRPLTLGNALIQNVASGNTMVFNARLLEILRHIRPEHSVLHDWSAYLAVTACGGVVHFDRQPYLLYRQHAANVVGADRGTAARIRQLITNRRGRYRERCDRTERAMIDITRFLTEPARRIFVHYQAARHATTGMARLRHAFAAGLFRQTKLEQALFLAAVAAGLA